MAHYQMQRLETTSAIITANLLVLGGDLLEILMTIAAAVGAQ